MIFAEYYKENMNAIGLPAPKGLYLAAASSEATATAILKN